VKRVAASQAAAPAEHGVDFSIPLQSRGSKPTAGDFRLIRTAHPIEIGNRDSQFSRVARLSICENPPW